MILAIFVKQESTVLVVYSNDWSQCIKCLWEEKPWNYELIVKLKVGTRHHCITRVLCTLDDAI